MTEQTDDQKTDRGVVLEKVEGAHGDVWVASSTDDVPADVPTDTPTIDPVDLIRGAFPLGVQAITNVYYPLFPSVHANRKTRRAVLSKARRGLPVSPDAIAGALYSKFIVESVKKLTTTKGA